MSADLPRPTAENWASLGLLGLVWGAAFFLTSEALEGFGPWTVAAGRTCLGGLALLSVAIAFGQGPSQVPGHRGWVFAFVIGLVSTALPFALLSLGLQYVPSAYAGVAMGSVPLLILPLVAIFSPEEGIGPRRVIGVILGFIGLLVLIGPEARAGTSAVIGQLACLGAASGYAIGSVATRRAPRMPPLTLASVTLCIAAVPLTVVAALREGWPAPTPAALAALIILALVPTAMAAVLRVRVITTAGSLFMSLVSYLVPAWAVVLGIVFRDEQLPPQLFAALALILVGIAISQSRALGSALKRR